jgi:hypothetical protein
MRGPIPSQLARFMKPLYVMQVLECPRAHQFSSYIRRLRHKIRWKAPQFKILQRWQQRRS